MPSLIPSQACAPLHTFSFLKKEAGVSISGTVCILSCLKIAPYMPSIAEQCLQQTQDGGGLARTTCERYPNTSVTSVSSTSQP